MKYKIGDKVRIKTWKEMEKEYGLSHYGHIKCSPYFKKPMEKSINYISSDRIVEIVKIDERYGGCYRFKGSIWGFRDDMIKELIEPEIIDPKDRINSRFEILDL